MKRTKSMFLKFENIPNREHSLDYFLKKENNNLDLIRLILSFFVIYSHAFVISPPSPVENYEFLIKITGLNYVSFGGIAVKTFFLISGVLVTSSLISNKNITNYILSRLFRLLPAFYITISLSAILAFFLSSFSAAEYFKSKELIQYISKTAQLNIQYNLPGVFENNSYKAFNGSLWSIPFEIKAYLYLLVAYSFSLAFGKHKKIFIGVIALSLIVEPLSPFKGAIIAKSENPDIYLLYPLFSIGVILSLLKKTVQLKHLLIAVCALFITFLLTTKSQEKIILINMIIPLTLFLLSLPTYGYLRLKNDISYGVYLWAFPIQQTIAIYLPSQPWMNMTLGFIISCFFGYISCLFVEKPAMHILKKATNHSSIQNDTTPSI